MTDVDSDSDADIDSDPEADVDGFDSPLVEQCAAEVEELHAFFELWFSGNLPATREAFERFEDVLDPAFEMVQPSGLRRSKSGIASDVFDAHGVHETVTIETTAFEPRHVDEDACLGTYEEWQTVGEERTGRTSTVLFRRDESHPNGVVWVHLHETWLEE